MLFKLADKKGQQRKNTIFVVLAGEQINAFN